MATLQSELETRLSTQMSKLTSITRQLIKQCLEPDFADTASCVPKNDERINDINNEINNNSNHVNFNESTNITLTNDKKNDTNLNNVNMFNITNSVNVIVNNDNQLHDKNIELNKGHNLNTLEVFEVSSDESDKERELSKHEITVNVCLFQVFLCLFRLHCSFIKWSRV